MVAEAGGCAPSVASGGVDVEAGGYACAVQGLVVSDGVFGGDDVVVVGEYEEGGRGGGGNVLFAAIAVYECFRGVSAKQVVAGALVRNAFLHGDDGVEEDLECGALFLREEGAGCGGQMSAGRRSHDAYVGGVDVPLCGVAADGAQGLGDVGQGNVVLSFRQAVAEDEGGRVPLVEEGCPVVAFVVFGQPGVSSSREDQYGAAQAVGGLGQVGAEVGQGESAGMVVFSRRLTSKKGSCASIGAGMCRKARRNSRGRRADWGRWMGCFIDREFLG